MPVVTWINYGVHGAEESGMDASLPFVYHLAAAQDPKLDDVLDKSVILITAVFNPDGHSHRIAWLDTWGGRNAITDPAHIEHNFSWGFARTNHYAFDLNRQWLLVTQPEPRAWIEEVARVATEPDGRLSRDGLRGHVLLSPRRSDAHESACP